MNFLKKYNGKNIKIAVIDNGYHFPNYDDVYLIKYDGNSAFIDYDDNYTHGQNCIDLIKTIAYESTILSIDARNDKHKVTEDTILKSLLICKDADVDIVSISQGLNSISDEFSDIISLLAQKGIIIVAARNSDELLTFPCDLEGVISVDEHNGEGIIYTHLGIQIPNKLLKIEGSNETLHGSSFATAYFAAMCAKILEFNPLATNVLDTLWPNRLSIEEYQQEYKLNSAFFLIDDDLLDIFEYRNIIIDSYKYYYCLKTNSIKSVIDDSILEEKPIECLDIINACSYSLPIPYIDMSVPNVRYFGSFDNCAIDDSFNLQHKILKIKKPVICILSYGSNMDKSYIHLELAKAFAEHDIEIANITYNPRGRIFGFTTLSYPNNVVYPDYLYYINNQVEKASICKDCVIITIPESSNRGHEIKCFGKFVDLFCMAIDIDIIVLSISTFINFDELIVRKAELEEQYGAKVLVYVTNKSKASQVTSYYFEAAEDEFMHTVSLISQDSINNYKKELLGIFDSNDIFDSNNFATQMLYKRIIEELT